MYEGNVNTYIYIYGCTYTYAVGVTFLFIFFFFLLFEFSTKLIYRDGVEEALVDIIIRSIDQTRKCVV